MLADLLQRPEIARTGVYFLVGPDFDNLARTRVYIGETDDVAVRLKQHNRSGEQGGKDFWERVCVVTSKDHNLTKAHVKHLESLLIAAARDSGRSVLENGNQPDYTSLPEADKADMAFFDEQIRTVLPVLGFDFLRSRPHIGPRNCLTSGPANAMPIFSMSVPKHGVSAEAREQDGDFIVLSGSTSRDHWSSSHHAGYQLLFEQLVQDGVLSDVEAGVRRFTIDFAFSSPSAAAAIVSGRPTNGRISWVDKDSGVTYAQWQEQRVDNMVV
ncbi:GIY-YIG nuclease family protein [Frateuria sp. GZRe12]|uniref:GIY-YIG nuclease family protein n=1 Tax=Frateuria sp. GZRe12 TaxID=3351533 RepID=UPI003EDC2D21